MDNEKISLIKLVTTIMLVFFTAYPVVGSATTIHVPDDYITIQEAVNAAEKDDIVIVRDGTYNENVDVNKPLTIQSENGFANCIVRASNPKDHVFEVTAHYVNIDGFTVTGATSGLPYYSAGIYLANVEHCSISNNNALDNNDGILAQYLCNYNTFTNNTANSNNNDGIHLGLLGYTCNYNTLTDNTANSNGYSGIYLASSSNNTLTNNTALYNPSGIFLSSSSKYNLLNKNTASSNKDYGIRLFHSENNNITNNTASNNDYGIYLVSSNNNNVHSNNLINNRENIFFEEDRGIPGFKAVFLIAGLLAVAYLLRRRG